MYAARRMASVENLMAARYEALIAAGTIEPDPAQHAIVRRLDLLQRELVESGNRRPSRWIPWRRPAVPKGMYLWGGVGRGKTFLMDLFFGTLPTARKKRIHFHRMMREVHRRLRRLADVADPLADVADGIADEISVLCFDEFYVSDIGDAMILGRLLGALFERGVVIVTTSNSEPRNLYRDGLQRARFLPAIEAIEANMQVIELDGDADYRLRLLEAAGTWLVPADDCTDRQLARFFDRSASGEIALDGKLSVNGRDMECRRVARGVVWFEFAALCDGPRSQDDYIEIARWFPTIIVSSIRPMGAATDNAARRFIALIDEFYDRKVKLVASADVAIEALYSGERLAFEFRRTTSRLIEMQTLDYLHAGHLA